MEQVFLKYIDDPNQHKIDTYIEHGGYQAIQKVFKEYQPTEVIDTVKASGVRGRGGAGFPAGLKWSFVPQNTGKPIYLACNGDESEPGTCKDRVIMENNPHLIIEGIMICCYAINAHHAFIYIRGEFAHPAARVEAAINEAYAKGYLGKNIFGTGFDLDIIVHTGGGAYICGEETSLLSSIEGSRGNARIRPPFPAVEGLYKCPTVINNVETLSSLPSIFNNGVEWYRSHGTEKSPGTKIFSLSGNVNKPGNYEVDLGTPLSYVINDLGGGIQNGHKLKAIIPGGSSTPLLMPDQIDTPLDYEAVAEAGSMLGSGAIIVIDERSCMVWVLMKLINFYAHESCGRCTPCREGTAWLKQLINRIENGDGQPGDIELILDVCDNIMGRTICPLGDAAVMPVRSFIQHFRDEFEYHIEHKKCKVETDYPFV
ncbi:MAG: NADH-quinone oxidoreductase subunit NuoF [candidate division Zixibacteria bacterium]|nr:NADH-quinone oxidoreductase subunit NuoF [candidate division Zixibacteria bacterium]